jgi:hypothetical protein
MLLSCTDTQAMEEEFLRIDTDGTGELSLGDFKAVIMQQLGSSKATVIERSASDRGRLLNTLSRGASLLLQKGRSAPVKTTAVDVTEVVLTAYCSRCMH